jgi:molybdopterin molybdotransferase
MIEHTVVSGDHVSIRRAILPGENVNPCGCELAQHEHALEPGRRLGFAEIGLLASLGRSRVRVYAQPKIAIVATGDELIDIAQQPEPHQIRNSNSYSLAAQVRRAGGSPHLLGVARDEYNCTRALLERGLSHDLLLLSGGVSAGKYDIVEHVLADLGAEFSFDRVRIQPGQPLVFGRARNTFFFGLPGNPVSTMVTFEVFAKAAVELLGGQCETLLPLTRARLRTDFRQKPGLTRFLPARLNHDGSELEPMSWHGSGDLAAVTKANAFLVTEPDRETWHAGDWIRVLLK